MLRSFRFDLFCIAGQAFVLVGVTWIWLPDVALWAWDGIGWTHRPAVCFLTPVFAMIF